MGAHLSFRRPQNDISKFTEALLHWYKTHKRDLPWRKNKDPYSIWISEIMLQQTQVKTALPYYLSFIKKFPTLDSLARASLQEILKSWQGLGYYSRARHLHSTAAEVRGKYGGKFPQDRKTLLSLPGIGPYTASAIASIAFGEQTPVVDGNVWRVFSRILADGGSAEKGKKRVFEFLKKIIPHSDPSSFNQAMMELGSLVCMPKNPECGNCPVQSFCQAFKLNKVDNYPRIAQKKLLPHRNWISLVARHKNKVLLRQRPLRGIWGGLWEFPSIEIKRPHRLKRSAEHFAKRTVRLQFKKMAALKPLPHSFSHFNLILHPFLFEVENQLSLTGHVWTDIKNPNYPMPAPLVRILKAVQAKS